MITIELTYKGPGFAGVTQKEFSSKGGFRAWLESEAFAPFEPQKVETPEEATPEVSEADANQRPSIPDMGWIDKLLFPDRDDYDILLALGIPRSWGEQRARSMMAVMHRQEDWDRHDGLADAVIVLWLAKYQGLTPTGKVSQSKSKQILFSFRDQILEWLDDDRPRMSDAPAGTPVSQTRYDSPLSVKQWRCARKWYGYDTAKKRAQNAIERAQVVDAIEILDSQDPDPEIRSIGPVVNLSAPDAPAQLERIARQQESARKIAF